MYYFYSIKNHTTSGPRGLKEVSLCQWNTWAGKICVQIFNDIKNKKLNTR